MTPGRYAFLDGPHPLGFAHRGGAKERIENSWASFTHAYNLGYRYMETDVRATADGVVVAFHDPDLQRMAGRADEVQRLTWRTLSSVRLEGVEPVPRLEDLLGAWPDVRWNIDAKHDSVVGPLAEAILRGRATNKVCVTSFSDKRLEQVRRVIGPEVCTAMGPAAVAWLRVASLAPTVTSGPALAPLGRYGAVQVPTQFRSLPIVDRRFVDAAHRAGLQVHVWTIDTPEEMERLLDLGVDGIMTDCPTVLKEVLEKRQPV